MPKWLVDHKKKPEPLTDLSMLAQHSPIDETLDPTRQPTLGPSRESPFEGHLEIGVEVFFNARHSVTLQKSTGPIHNHSFRLKVCCAVNWFDETFCDPIPSAKIKAVVDQVVAPFNNQFLNALPVFASQQPTTEALAATLYRGLVSKLGTLPIRLVSLTLWESPTLSVTLSPRPSGS